MPPTKRIGVAIYGATANEALHRIQRAGDLGIPAADKFNTLLAYGMTEIIATPIPITAAWNKTARLLADVGKQLK